MPLTNTSTIECFDNTIHYARFVTPVHRFLQIRMTTGDPESAGQKRTPDSKVRINSKTEHVFVTDF